MNIDLIIFRRASLVKRRILPGLVVFLLLSLFALGVLYEQVDAQSRVDQARRVDVIVVLGCSVWPGGVPSPALAARTEHAIALYQEGYASHFLFRAGKIARDLGMQVYTSPASDSPTYTIPHLRVWYTTRETLAVVWYYATRILGEPVWLYQILKGKL